MSDITRVLPVPVTVNLAGKPYKVSELTLEDFAALQQWIKEHYPHPFDRIREHISKFDKSQQEILLRAAYEDGEDWPPSVLSERGRRLLLTSEKGSVEFIRLVLSKNQPDFTLADATHLCHAAKSEDVQALLSAAFGISPQEELEDEFLPKAQASRTQDGN